MTMEFVPSEVHSVDPSDRSLQLRGDADEVLAIEPASPGKAGLYMGVRALDLVVSGYGIDEAGVSNLNLLVVSSHSQVVERS